MSQLAKQKPATFSTSPSTTSFPIKDIFDVSLYHTGAAAVFNPFRSPATIRPTIMCGTPKAVICKIPPIIMTIVPKITDPFLPILEPKNGPVAAPKKHPTS